MITAAFKALGDLMSRDFRAILFRAVGMTLGLFIAILIGVEVLLSYLLSLPWPWAETLAGIGTFLVLLVAFFFMMAPVTAIFAGLYLDDVAGRVEAKHYGRDPKGTPLSGFRALQTSLQFALVILLVNIAVLPLVFTGIGALALIIANAYLLSREFFEMIAMRHMTVDEARQLRKINTPRILAAGFAPAILSIIPVVNLVVPLFATSYFTHIFKQVRASSP
ncbi:MAG: EI24 domain-containing protein [Aestuariivirga sp.]